MKWKDKFILKLNLEDESQRIIIDSSGLLLSSEFTSFLSDNKFDFAVVSTFKSLLEAETNKTKLILSPKNDIPHYIQNQYTVTKFDLSDLPYNIDFEVLKKLTIPEIIHLLNYVSTENEHLPVNPKNAETILSLAINYSIQKQISDSYIQINQILNSPAHYNKILKIGILWGELLYLCFKIGVSPDIEIQNKIDSYSTEYILSGSLKNIFYEHYSNIKSVDKIIAYLKSKVKNKTALICFDCLGVAEWFLLKDFLFSLGFQYYEHFIYSLIPSITLFSRNVIFSGNYNDVWELKTNSGEEKALSNNFPEMEVTMFREKHTLTSDSFLGIDFITIIYTFFDDIAHSVHFPAKAEKTKELYFKQIFEYLQKSNIKETLLLLKKEGYQIYFCSDHGSVVAEGIGKAVDKFLIDKSSKRASYVTASTLLENLKYKQYEIPFIKDKIVLLPEGRTMFHTKGTVGITHGGITVEEIIVPFIELKVKS